MYSGLFFSTAPHFLTLLTTGSFASLARFRQGYLLKVIHQVSEGEQTAWECEEEPTGLPGKKGGREGFLPRLWSALAWCSQGRLH